MVIAHIATRENLVKPEIGGTRSTRQKRRQNTKLHHYECEGQLNIFNFLQEQESNHDLRGDPDYKEAKDEITRYSIEADFERTIKLRKCPECFEDPESYFKSCHEYWVKCPKCGRETEHFKKMYKAMQAWNRNEVGKPRSLPIWEYLRYGPHTKITSVRVETKEWLDRYGVPDWIKWPKDSLPCENCTWYDGTNCCSGGHTNHFEYGFLICDGFHQSIVERKPTTVGK